ncbi:hypothetical protein F4803DRAFT_514400 [Xylaria telfairii]|nr:hypothetical protein F4803DRAFT_514400 [Xylaria telfairii]
MQDLIHLPGRLSNSLPPLPFLNFLRFLVSFLCITSAQGSLLLRQVPLLTHQPPTPLPTRIYSQGILLSASHSCPSVPPFLTVPCALPTTVALDYT